VKIKDAIVVRLQGIGYAGKLEVAASGPSEAHVRRHITQTLFREVLARLHSAFDLAPRDPYGAMREIGELIQDIEEGNI